MRIAITGSSGLIGSALVPALEASGHTVVRMVRGRDWDPRAGTVELSSLEACDAVVHLAGASLAGLWTRARKRRIFESRERGTRALAMALARLSRPPSVLLSASAIGYYGPRAADERVAEGEPRGPGFLADVVEAWERAADPARDAGIRVVNSRFAVVLSAQGGALAAALPIFRLGLGGRLGSGRQIWSWVAIDDVVQAIAFCLARPDLSGPVNVAAPQAVTNLAFTRTLGRVLRRPTIMAVPAFALKLAGGQMAREALLSGVRVVPRKLEEAGYEFRYAELETALRHLLATP
ncbi:MAG: TIGR01777 family oxidoreductase [Gemmatimonadota bacterium]